MSVAVVVKKGNCAAIGSDTLTKLSSTKESADYIKNSSKIMKLGESYIAPIGHASNILVLSNYFARLKELPLFDSPENIFEAARQLHRSLKEDYFLNPVEDDEGPYESSPCRCLIANPNGIFGVYYLRSVQEYTKFYAFGTGYEYALGAMKAVYDRVDSAEEIAKIGLEAAVEFDEDCGGPIEIFTVALKEKSPQ